MSIKKLIFSLKMCHFKAIIFKKLALRTLRSDRRLKKPTWKCMTCKCLRRGNNSTWGPKQMDEQLPVSEQPVHSEELQ